MNWFEKIKSMSPEELAEFLANFDIDNVNDSFCECACEERERNGFCKHNYNCPFNDSYVIKKWLHTKANEN